MCPFRLLPPPFLRFLSRREMRRGASKKEEGGEEASKWLWGGGGGRGTLILVSPPPSSSISPPSAQLVCLPVWVTRMHCPPSLFPKHEYWDSGPSLFDRGENIKFLWLFFFSYLFPEGREGGGMDKSYTVGSYPIVFSPGNWANGLVLHLALFLHPCH